MRLIAPDREIQVEMIAVLRIGVGPSTVVNRWHARHAAAAGTPPPGLRLSHDRCGADFAPTVGPHRIRAFPFCAGMRGMARPSSIRAGTVGPARASMSCAHCGLYINGMMSRVTMP